MNTQDLISKLHFYESETKVGNWFHFQTAKFTTHVFINIKSGNILLTTAIMTDARTQTWAHTYVYVNIRMQLSTWFTNVYVCFYR